MGPGGQYQINDNGVGTFAVAAGAAFTLNGTGSAGYAGPGAIALTVQSSSASPNSTITNAVVLAGNATVGVYSTASGTTTPIAFPAFLNLTGTVSGGGTLTTAGVAATNGAGGVLTLTGNNTYTGGTNVASGSLRVNNTAGSGTGTGAVNVLAGGTLGGTGTVGNTAGPVSVQGIITAGANASTGIGTLTTGAERWTAGGGLLAKVVAAGLPNDELVMSWLAVAATAGGQFSVNVANVSSGTTIAANTVLVLAEDTEPAATNAFGPNLAAATLAALTLNVSSGVTSATGSFALGTQADPSAGGGFDLVLEDAATPEPASLLLLTTVVGPLLVGRRRRPGRPVSA